MVLEVEALAPFYKRWWFLALMLALVASLLYAGHRWQIRRYQRQQRMLEAEIGQRTAHIQAQAQELQVLNAQQARFFSNISHELRTPLTLLCSPIDELLGQLPADTPAEVADSLRSMRQSGAQLIDLVDELLEMARLETGKLRPEPTPCLIHGFLSTLAAPFQTHAGYQHIRFGLRLSVPPDAWLMADERKVGKIIGNLLGNAFKYTPDHGEVVLESWLEGEVWMTAVEDTGMGISAEALPHIFERFYQQDSARAGAGIGLSFAKELADLMGGSLAVSSAPGQGSRFVLSLPAVPAVPPSPEALPERSATAPPIVSGSCILLVEDHAPLRDFTRRLLEPEYRVLTAGNGAEAWDLLQGAAADAQLIISDVVMPELDGFGLLQRVRAHQGNRAVPFIFLTALSAPQHRIKGFATGVDDYLTKPFQPQELRVRVRSLLERYQQRTQAHHEPQEEEEGEDGQQPVAEERPHDEASPQDWAWIQEVEARIREEVGNPSFGIWTLADSMNLSYRQFNRKIKQLTGLSPLHYQREVKLQVARELLEGTSLSLEKVADRVGFSKASYLAKLYRERFGELPHEA
jgi:signal transduction histidine kinase/CheY-like chemotaxis protein